MVLWHCNYLRSHYRRFDCSIHGGDVSVHRFTQNNNNVRLCECRLYDRHLKTQPPRQSSGVRYRLETLVGITGVRLAKYRQSWNEIVFAPIRIIWRPHLFLILLFEAMVFGFSIGINVIFFFRDLPMTSPVLTPTSR